MTFKVSVDQSDIVFNSREGETLLDAIERAGYAVPYSCRMGVCIECAGKLCDGTVSTWSGEISGPADEVLFCQARPVSDVRILPSEIDDGGPEISRYVRAAVHQITHPTSEISILKVRFPIGVRVKFRAGQYLRIILPNRETREFYMANAPQMADGVEIHVRSIPGGLFATSVLASLERGDTLDLDLPYGDFYLRTTSDRPMLMIATGVGFAPLKSMIESLLQRDNTRPTHLFWGGRRKQDLYMADLVRHWTAQAGWLKFTPVLSEPEVGWSGATGQVEEAALRDLPDLSGWQVYACGDPQMIEQARSDFISRAGLPEGEFFADSFGVPGRLP